MNKGLVRTRIRCIHIAGVFRELKPMQSMFFLYYCNYTLPQKKKKSKNEASG